MSIVNSYPCRRIATRQSKTLTTHGLTFHLALVNQREFRTELPLRWKYSTGARPWEVEKTKYYMIWPCALFLCFWAGKNTVWMLIRLIFPQSTQLITNTIYNGPITIGQQFGALWLNHSWFFFFTPFTVLPKGAVFRPVNYRKQACLLLCYPDSTGYSSSIVIHWS